MTADISAINKAAFEGNEELLVELLSATENVEIYKLVDPMDSNRGPLHFAILGKQVETVRRLLDQYNASPFLLDEVHSDLT